MSHFAQLDDNNIVTQVIVVNNNELLDENGQESEAKGIAFCQSLYGGKWVQTSYNNNFRGTYAGIGYTYNQQEDIFIAPQPYPSWILNKTSWLWEAPEPYPTDGKIYEWNEDKVKWILKQ